MFVVDSSSEGELTTARSELEAVLTHPGACGSTICGGHQPSADMQRRVPILVLANKMDRDAAMSPVQVRRCASETIVELKQITLALGLEQVADKPWHISFGNAVLGET